MTWRGRITVSAAVAQGRPIIRGTQVSVDALLELVARGASVDEVLLRFPELRRDDVLAALQYVRDVFRDEEFVA